MSFLTAQEELLLVKLYITKIPQLCGHFRFPEEVEATAVSYLKRFYLRNTVMDWHPKNVMYVSLQSFFRVAQEGTHLQAYSLVSGDQDNKQPYISRVIYVQHPSNIPLGCS